MIHPARPGRPAWRPLLAALLLVLAAAPAAGATAGTDYDPGAIGWSGLAYLSRTADEAHVVLPVRTHVDWRAVERDDVLLLVYPLSPPEPTDLVAFLEDGGHAIVADDFGGAPPLLAAVGLERVPAPADAARAYGGHPAFPVFALPDAAVHFLFFHADRVVANHPSALAITAPDRCASIIAWPGDDAPSLVAECRVGRGRLLAIADASLFINEMLRGVHGDKQFVANVLRYYCGPAECEVDLVPPRATWAHRYRPGPPPVTDLKSFFRASFETLDRLVADANEALARLPFAPWLGLAASLLVLALVLRHHVRPRREAFRGYRAPPTVDAPASALQAQTLAGRRRADFSEPLGLLRRRLERRLAAAGGERAGDHHGEVEALLAALRRLPTGPGVRDGRIRTVSASEFLSFYRQIRALEGDTPPPPVRKEPR